MDRILKVLAIVWSVVAFIAAVAFFAGGEWADWQKVKLLVLDPPEGETNGFDIANDQLVRVTGDLDINGDLDVGENRWGGEPKSETAGGSMKFCPEGWYVVGVRGVDTDGGDYCRSCISQIEFTCRQL